MKKITIFLLALMMTILFVGCNGTPNESVPPVTNGTQIKITVGDDIFTATLADNQTAEAFAEMLPLTLDMSEMNGNEKYYYIIIINVQARLNAVVANVRFVNSLSRTKLLPP